MAPDAGDDTGRDPGRADPSEEGAAPPASVAAAGTVSEPSLLPWESASAALAEARGFVVSTTRPDGTPHAVPVLALWLAGAVWFAAGPATRKARNLAASPRCVVTTGVAGMDLVVEGTAVTETDGGELAALAAGYRRTYGWDPAVRGGMLWADGAPSAGPPPYAAYQVEPHRVLAFPAGDVFRPTRYRFDSAGRPGQEPLT